MNCLEDDSFFKNSITREVFQGLIFINSFVDNTYSHSVVFLNDNFMNIRCKLSFLVLFEFYIIGFSVGEFFAIPVTRFLLCEIFEICGRFLMISIYCFFVEENTIRRICKDSLILSCLR